ncbi:hypothetical protein VTH06DRAFT_329 [Thermothelomyces fergusii]
MCKTKCSKNPFPSAWRRYPGSCRKQKKKQNHCQSKRQTHALPKVSQIATLAQATLQALQRRQDEQK